MKLLQQNRYYDLRKVTSFKSVNIYSACKRLSGRLFIILLFLFFIHHNTNSKPEQLGTYVAIQQALQNLLTDEDTDSDKRITVNDNYIPGTENGNKRFELVSIDQRRYEITGTYHLSNLLQELQLLRESGIDTGIIRIDRIYEQPADRISRNIREIFWDSLTRRIDETGLLAISADSKIAAQDGCRYLYIPSSDKLAVNYFNGISKANPGWNLEVIMLPDQINGDYIKTLNRRPGILSLALFQYNDGSISGVPFVVPGGRFNEMY